MLKSQTNKQTNRKNNQMHPEQNEREATIDTEDEKTICERERKK